VVANANRLLKVEGSFECILVERLNRFVIKVILDGRTQRAYINNTGRLAQYLAKGRRGFCIRNVKSNKTDCRLFSVGKDRSAALIDTHLQMKAFEKAVEFSLIPWLKGYRILKRNVFLDSSIIDFLLECGEKKLYLEVKSAVFLDGRFAMYPDCLSTRGRRHIERLIRHVKNGGFASILFIAAMAEAEAFRPNCYIDPVICKLLREAHNEGVDLKCVKMCYCPEDSFIYLLDADLRVEVPPP